MHKVQHKEAIYPFACTSCEYNAPNQDNLLAHLKIHVDEKPYPCHICSYRAKNRTGINAHLKRKNHAAIRNARILYKCGICSHQLTTPSDLRNHLITHIRSPDLVRLKLTCECNYVTKFDEIPIHVNDHFKTALDVEKLGINFLCTISDSQEPEVYTDNVPNVPCYNYEFQEPAQWVPDDCLPQYPNVFGGCQYFNRPPVKITIGLTCTVCNYVAYDYTNLNYHVATHSTVLYDPATNLPVMYTCNICKYRAQDEPESMQHMSCHVAFNYESFVCEICNYMSYSQSDLDVHKLTHVPENVKCDLCGYNSSSNADLQLHMMLHTPSEESFVDSDSGESPTFTLDQDVYGAFAANHN